MVYALIQKITGYLLGTEVVTVDNGAIADLGVTTGQIANAPGPAGSTTQNFGRAGLLSSQPSAAGVSPAATAGDYVLANFQVQANAFDQAGRTLEFQAIGSYAANGNTKRVKVFVGATTATVGAVIVGGTVIADSGAVTTNNAGFVISGGVTKYGAAGSNTQVAWSEQQSSAPVPQNLTLAENATINVTVTGNATTTASDIVLKLLQIVWDN